MNSPEINWYDQFREEMIAADVEGRKGINETLIDYKHTLGSTINRYVEEGFIKPYSRNDDSMDKTLSRLAKELKVKGGKRELYRTYQFYQLAPDIEQYKSQHPLQSALTWVAVTKELDPKLLQDGAETKEEKLVSITVRGIAEEDRARIAEFLRNKALEVETLKIEDYTKIFRFNLIK